MKRFRPIMDFSRTLGVLFLTLWVFVWPVRCEEKPEDSEENIAPASVEASVDRTEITIGDQIHYRLTIEYADGVEVHKPSWGEGLESFQILDFNKGKKEKIGDRWKVTDTYTLSTFTPEDYVIPPIRVPIRLPSGATQTLETQPISITVKSVLPEDEESMQLRDIRNPVPVYSGVLTGRVIAAVVVFLLILAFLYAVWRYKHRSEEPQVWQPPRPEDEVALERLSALRELVDGWGGTSPNLEQCKQYALELSELLREYLERRYKFLALEMTTDEISEYFRSHPLEKIEDSRENKRSSVSERVLEILRQTDLMKFAKVTQPVEWMKSCLDRCEEIILETRRKPSIGEPENLDVVMADRNESPQGKEAA